MENSPNTHFLDKPHGNPILFKTNLYVVFSMSKPAQTIYLPN